MGDKVRMREFLASPAGGSVGEAEWTQSMGTMMLRVPLRGKSWEGVREMEFNFEISAEELRVTNEKRQEKKDPTHVPGMPHRSCHPNVSTLDALSGVFQHKCIPKWSRWWLESDPDDDNSKSLVIELCKLKDKSWSGPWVHGLYKPKFFPWKEGMTPPPEPERKWQKLKYGKRLDIDDPYISTRSWLF